ncbi:hypothetical protein BHE74_00051457 [Ensete ventricosum]|nr:hypothetical protein BHE74_00051457 [Ensete ventricosum]
MHVMLPLRFPNNGIKDRLFMRMIEFRLPVLRLNHIELFYAFLLCFRSKGVTNYDEGPYRGSPVRVGPHARVVAYGQLRVGAARKGQSQPAWLLLISVVPMGIGNTRRGGAHRSIACGHCARPPVGGCYPRAAAPTAWAATACVHFGIEPGSDDAVGSRRKFTRRFAEGIEKLAKNTKGDCREEDRRTYHKYVRGYWIGGC